MLREKMGFPVRLVAGSKVEGLERIADSVGTVRMARLLRGVESGGDLESIEDTDWDKTQHLMLVYILVNPRSQP